MPSRTGIDALPELKHVAPDAKVIVLSGFATSMVAAEVLALGADRYVEKGVDPDTIAATIEEVAAAAPEPRRARKPIVSGRAQRERSR